MKLASLILSFFILTIVPLSAESNNENFEIDDAYSDKLFITLKYGATASWLTRIIKQTERSNFVFEDFLPGLFFGAELQNIPNITPEVRIAAYYPLISSFNDVPQFQNTPLHFGADLFAGARFKIIDWKVLRLNAGPGLHMFFMTADRWNYLNLGAAAAVGFELAVSRGWSMLIDGFASLDYGNLGTNGRMEPFDIGYQYQVAIGARYSKKLRNKTALFMPRDNKSRTTIDR